MEQLDEAVTKVNLTSADEIDCNKKRLMHVVNTVAAAVVEFPKSCSKSY